MVFDFPVKHEGDGLECQIWMGWRDGHGGGNQAPYHGEGVKSYWREETEAFFVVLNVSVDRIHHVRG